MENATFDRRILDPAFPLEGPHLIEASAGTGKTYNIQNVYARLVMEKRFKVSEILVMTFTNAAAKELHDRLHLVLKDLQQRFQTPAADCLNDQGTKEPHRNERADALIRCVPPESREAARSAVELALLEFDNAAISTIHGFCQRILSRCAFETGANPAAELEDRKKADLEELAENWWRKRPADAPSGIRLKDLTSYVGTLSGKNGYLLDQVDAKSPEGFLLLKAHGIVEAYDDEMTRREKLNFDDLPRLLQRALRADASRTGAFAAQLRQEFKAALIDEFQDTDPGQFEIFQKIFLAEGQTPLFFVGDPKQAIYSFRGGDVYAYLEAKKTPGLQIGTLSENHRSTSYAVAAVNAMFRDEEGLCVFGDPLIGYRDPVTVGREPDTHGRPLLKKPLQLVVSGEDEALPELLADEVCRLLAEKGEGAPYAPRDVAVLTNSNTQNALIRDALRRRNVPGVIQKPGNVFASSVAVEWRIFLLAILDAGNRPLLLAALATAFGGVPLDGLPQEGEPELLGEARKRFSELHELWRSRGLAALVARTADEGCRERLAVHADGERLLTDLEQIWELSFAAVKTIGPSPERFLEWLTDRINASHGGENDESEAEAYARELESDENAVRIMTIHGSKGLQFPVVFLAEAWKLTSLRDPRNQLSLPSYHDEKGRLVFSFEAQEAATLELQLEKRRLLYVALTRAIERTVVVMPPREKIAGSEPLLPLLDHLVRRAPENSLYEWRRADAEPVNGGRTFVLSAKPPEVRHALAPPDFTAWNRLFKGSYSSLTPSMHGEEDDDGRDVDCWSAPPDPREELLPVFQVPEGAATGTCWHNVLEKVPFDAEEEAIRRIAARELAASGIDGAHLEETVRMIRLVLETPLLAPDGERFTLSAVPSDRRLSEQEFHFSTLHAAEKTDALYAILKKHWAGDPGKAAFLAAAAHWSKELPCGFMTGFIDLLFQHGEFFYVVDWKSNSLDRQAASFDEEGVRNEMARHGYFFQYLLYSVVLHRYLKQILGSRYCWATHFGGIRYYFLRGIAAGGTAPVFADRPAEALLDELAAALGLEDSK